MPTRLVVPLFVGWTLVVWIGRIRNILGDDELSTGGRTWRIGAAVLFVLLALAVLVTRRLARPEARAVLAALVLWTIGWWSVRGVGILLDASHDTGFKVVHTVLMVGSIAFAVWAWARRDG